MRYVVQCTEIVNTTLSRVPVPMLLKCTILFKTDPELYDEELS